MQIYDELVARGLIAQVTDEKEIRDLVTTERLFFTLALTPLRTHFMLVTSWLFA